MNDVTSTEKETKVTPCPVVTEGANTDADVALVSMEEFKVDTPPPAVLKKAQANVAQLLDFTKKTGNKLLKAQDGAEAAVLNFGKPVQRDAAGTNDILRRQIKEFSSGGGAKSEAADGLMQLSSEMAVLDPGDNEFLCPWYIKWAIAVPFIGSQIKTPLQTYFLKFQTADDLIQGMVTTLDNLSTRLDRNNKTLKVERLKKREVNLRLDQVIQVGMLMDKEVVAKMDELGSEDSKYEFIQDKLLYPLRKRVEDLQVQRVANYQGIISMDLIIKDNEDLIQGIFSAKTVSVSTLETAVMIAGALADIEITLKALGAIKKTTGNMLKSNAKRLKQATTTIAAQKGETTISMEDLRESFQDLREAVTIAKNARAEALPKMAESIKMLETFSEDSKKLVVDEEEGTEAVKNMPQLAV